MKLIKNLVCTKLESGYLLINTLNGLMDLVDQSAIGILEKWNSQESIEVQTQVEKEFYNALYTRGYLCTSYEEEQKKKDVIIQTLRKRYQENKNKVRTLTFVMTYDCNFRCPYCFESIEKHLRGMNINEKHIDAALALAGEELEHIGLFGGEPLLPRNRRTIEYLFNKTLDKSYDVITNGYYLDQFIDLLTCVNVSYVMVTLDGKRETHNKRRYLANAEPTFDKILHNIQKCLENRIPVRIRMNIDQNTIGEATELRNVLLSTFQDYINLLSFEISPMMEMSFFERNQLYSTLVKNDTECKQPGSQNVLLSRFSPAVNSLIHRGRLHPTYSYCAGHQTGYIVDPLGFIYPCLVAVGKYEYAVGTYYPKVCFFENSVNNRNIDTIEKCQRCAYSLLCGGGCPLKLVDSKDVYKPECGSIFNEIHQMLPLLLQIKDAEKTVSVAK